MPKRVFYICSGRSFRSDRLGRKMKDLVKCWRELGYEVEHVCGGDLYPASVSLEDEIKSTTQYYQKWYRRTPLMGPLVNSYSELRCIRHNRMMLDKLTSLLEQRRPDVVWERSSRLATAGLKVAQERGIPYVHEWIDNVVSYSISLFHHKAVRAEKRKNQEADYIVVVSNKIKETLVQEGINRDKILVAFNAVNPEEFQVDHTKRREYRYKLGIKENEILVGYLGSYAFYHDTARLVLAADILRKRQEAAVKILMVGTGKEYKDTRRLVEERGLLGSMIMMEPWVPKEAVPKVLSGMDIAVLPGSTDIICPIKVQEYMALELATVVPDYSCNREVVTDGQTGMFFEPKGEESLAAKLLLLARDHGLRASLGRNAREEVLRRFTWEQTWGKALTEVMRRINSKAR